MNSLRTSNMWSNMPANPVPKAQRKDSCEGKTSPNIKPPSG